MSFLQKILNHIFLVFFFTFSLYSQEIIDIIETDEFGYLQTSQTVVNDNWIFIPSHYEEGYIGISAFKITENETIHSAINRGNVTEFGRAIDSDNDWLVAYSNYDSDLGTSNNFYFYQLINDGWTFQQHFNIENATLYLEEEYPEAGYFVSMDNDWCVIGDFDNDSLFIYHLEEGLWNEHQTIVLDDTTSDRPDPLFGYRVELNGDYMAVTAPHFDYGADEGDIAAYYIYKKQPDNTWIKLHSIYTETSYNLTFQGNSFDISENTFVYRYRTHASVSGDVHVISFDDDSLEEAFVLSTGNIGNGSAIELNNDELFIADIHYDSYKGGIFYYQLHNGIWEYISTFSPPTTSVYLGSSIARENDYLYSTTFRDVYIIGVQEPTITSISKGHSKSYSKITWDDNSEIEDGFTIYRDGAELATTGPSARTYFDYEGVPGKMHSYSVSTYDEETGWSSQPNESFGYKQPSGVIEGVVQTPLGAGVNEVQLSLDASSLPTNRAIFIDSLENSLIIEDVSNFPDTAITVSFWLKANSDSSGYLFDFSNDSYADAFSILNPQSLEIKINDRLIETLINFADDTWHHFAVSWRSADGQLIIYNNGTEVFEAKFQGGEIFDSQNGVINFGANISGSNFNGWLDELRVWSIFQSGPTINLQMNKSLIGNEQNLITSYSFNDPQKYPENYIADEVWKSTNHGSIMSPVFVTNPDQVIPMQYETLTSPDGKFAFKNIYFDESRDFNITPYKEDHGFSPSIAHSSLDLLNPKVTNVGIDDTTSFTVSGYISYSTTGCFLTGAEIIMDGQSTGVFTNSDGFYQITVEESGNHQFEIQFTHGDIAHNFRPAVQNLLVADNLFNINFEDITTSNLSGRVGAACNTSLGVATLSISSNSGCFTQTVTTDASGFYSTDLPAQEYFVEVTDLLPSNPIILDSYNTFSTDLTFRDSTINFIYREPLAIEIDGFPEVCSGANVPVVAQYERYFLTITVLDSYDGSSCPVDTGSITIYDDLSDNGNNPITLPLSNGQAHYILEPGIPNTLEGGSNPYQKLFNVVANVDGENASLNQWAIVTGHKPSSETFVTKTPELPLMILRDPPGDQSYSYLEEGHSVTLNYSMSHEINGSGGIYANIKIGAGVPVPFTGIVIGARTHIQAEVMAGRNNHNGTSLTTTISQTERFTTSDSRNITGEKGDVFIGASLNMIYALTEVLSYDEEICSVVIDTQLVWGSEEINTSYIYTENHISNTLIPQLNQLRTLVSPDSALLIQSYIDVWEQVMENNIAQKERAEKIKNISFSAGVTNEFSETTRKDTTTHVDFTVFVDAGVKIGVGIGDGGKFADTEFGVAAKFRWSQTTIIDSTFSSTTRTGYVLSDDNPGDFFSVDIKEDKEYGSLVFDVIGGRSSCPWEQGTQPRDGPNLNINTYAQFDVDPDNQAAFILGVGNMSESGETRDYNLSVIQSSNLDGAIIRVGGVVIEDALSYTVPAGEQITATMAIERGPLAYDYENLKIRLYSECDPSLSDILNFSVHFQSPCSDVNIFRPENNWVVNSSYNDTLPIIINNYDINDASLDNIKLEYRISGGSWTTAQVFQKNALPETYINFKWNISNLQDGSYELRAAARCGDSGTNYSSITNGRIDRTSLALFGKPQPSDKILNIGDNIKFTFTEDLQCGEVTSDNITLLDEDGNEIEVTVACSDKEIIITPNIDLALLEGKELTAIVSGIKDVNANFLLNSVEWTFHVNQNPLYWQNSIVQNTFYQNNAQPISASLINAGAANESFQIISLPEWLSANMLSGNISASGTLDIEFDINQSINIGTYSDTVYAQTANGNEPLYIEITLLASPPQWQVNSAEFEHSMTITSQLNIEGSSSDDKFDMVSAFINNEVRGVSNIQFVNNSYGYLAFITVYSNSLSGEQIQFRGWDASAGNEYGNVGEVYTFQSGTNIGDIIDPVILNPQGIVQNISMNSGWTWISFNVKNTNMKINDVLARMPAVAGDIIKSHTEFAMYMEDKSWQGSLKTLKTGKAYLVKLANPSSLEFIGKRINSVEQKIALETGWNWIGYPENRFQDINMAFKNLAASDGDIIKSQTDFAQFNKSEQTWIGSLETLNPGEGYLYKSNKATNFNYPSFSKINDNTEDTSVPESWKVNPSNHEYTMSVVADINFASKTRLDTFDIIAAFVDGECRGITSPVFNKALNQYQVFLAIHGKKDEELSFRVLEQETGVVYNLSKTIKFEEDALLGDAANPIEMKTSSTTDEGALPISYKLFGNYPNPFNPSTTIRYELPERTDVKLLVYDILGKQVAVLVNKSQNPGRYNITFNAASLGLSSGLYFYRIKAGNYSKVHKMLLVK